jgi:hypothetical protein
MIRLAQIEERLVRPERLARGPGVELSLWTGEATPLPAEKRGYLRGIQDAIAGLDAARVAPGVAAKRERAEGSVTSRRPAT